MRVETAEAVAGLEARLDGRLAEVEGISADLAALLEEAGAEGPPIEEALTRIEAIEGRVAGAETGSQDAGTRLGGIEGRVAELGERVDALYAGLPEEGEIVSPDALTPLRSALSAQDTRLTQLSQDLGGRLDAIDARLADLGDVAGRLDALSGDLETTRGDAQSGRDALSQEVATLREEAQSGRDELSQEVATLSEDAQSGRDALSEELATLRQAADEARTGLSDEIEALRGEVEAVSSRVDERQAAIDAEVAAARAEADAEAAAARAAASLARVRAAIDAGLPYQSELTELLGEIDMPVAATLINASEAGVPSLGALREEFPPLAREALRAAPAEGNRVEGFFRRQIGLRSLEAREGSGADAVLSRAEGALARGDLRAAVEELQALPEEARAPFEDWIAQAETRAIVEDSVGSLSDRMEGG